MQSERESCCGIISTTSRLIICESAFKNCTSAAGKNDLDSWSSCDNKWRADQSIQRSQNTRCLLPIRWINSCRDLWWHGYHLSTQFNSSLCNMSIVYCYRIEQVRTFKDDDESRTELDYSQLIDGAFLDNVLSRM